MKRLCLTLALVACTKGPVPVPSAGGDAGAPAAVAAAAASRVSHREELLREATTTGLDVVFQGWLEPKADLGAASADTCVRVRVADPGRSERDGAVSDTVTLIERDGEHERSHAFSVHDTWIAPTCVRRGTRVSLAASEPVEIVVVASSAFR